MDINLELLQLDRKGTMSNKKKVVVDDVNDRLSEDLSDQEDMKEQDKGVKGAGAQPTQQHNENTEQTKLDRNHTLK